MAPGLDPFSDVRAIDARPRLSSRTSSRNKIPTTDGPLTTPSKGGLYSSTTANSSPSTQSSPIPPPNPSPNTLRAALADVVTFKPGLPSAKSSSSLGLGLITPSKTRSSSKKAAALTDHSPNVGPPIGIGRDVSADDIPDYYKSDFAPSPPLDSVDRFGSSPASANGTFGKKELAKMEKDKKKKQAKDKKKLKAGAPLDFIDTLDTIGGFHHDGPFDAATSHRNRHTTSKNPSRQAPIAAFDPAALSAEGALRSQPNGSSGGAGFGGGRPSARAQAALAAMDNDKDLFAPSSGSNLGPDSHRYPPSSSHPNPEGDPSSENVDHVHRPRRGSESSLNQISMGYPAGKIARDPKAARLAEAFGIMDSEAWEDFGRMRFASRNGSNAQLPNASPNGVGTTGTGREGAFAGESGAGEKGGLNRERTFKAASVWDMEATLKEGRPVASGAPPVPALPPMPAAFRQESSPLANISANGDAIHSPNAKPPLKHSHSHSYSSNHRHSGGLGAGNNSLMPPNEGSPKRSKSLVARIKRGVRSPNVPLSNQLDAAAPASAIPPLPISSPIAATAPPIPPRPPMDEDIQRLSDERNNPSPPRPIPGLPGFARNQSFNSLGGAGSPTKGATSPRSPNPALGEYDGVGGADAVTRKPTLLQKIGFSKKGR